MKKALIAIACAMVGLGLMVPSASADVVLAIGDQYYLGYWTPDTPASEDKEQDYLNYLIKLVNGTETDKTDVLGQNFFPDGTPPAPPLPAVTFFGPRTNTGNTDPSPILVNGFTYVVGKYGTNAAAWYVGDISPTETVDLPRYFSGEQTNISHFTGFGGASVPDGGMTLMLLGGALFGVETLRRRIRG